ncbi:hypothetical protein B0H11DRAFT_1922242 [Mycena galericulata]|nr:hypothetical protein B0H11DRAFT_1922242 [Mycena galericulata]
MPLYVLVHIGGLHQAWSTLHVEHFNLRYRAGRRRGTRVLHSIPYGSFLINLTSLRCLRNNACNSSQSRCTGYRYLHWKGIPYQLSEACQGSNLRHPRTEQKLGSVPGSLPPFAFHQGESAREIRIWVEECRL